MAMNGFSDTVGKSAYAILFIAIIPALLIVWAIATADIVPLAVPTFRWAGFVVLTLGVFLMLAGTWALWFHGGGLPMGPYPPPVYVSKGVYRLIPHPIYVGFTMLCFGVSVITESPSGLWLVSPCVALGCAALVLGFERLEIRKRFGEEVVRRTLISLPVASTDPPTGWDRLSVILLVFLPWAILFEAVYLLGVPPDAVEAYLPLERDWPVWEWTEVIYGSVYFFVPLTLFVIPSKATLRRFAVLGLIATMVVTLIYLTVPVIAPPKPFETQTILGQILMFERALANTVAAFPAFHVIWALIAAEAWASRSPSLAFIGWVWAILITVSCITTGMHALLDLVAAAVFFLVLRTYRQIWKLLRGAAEHVANSWWEWRSDGVRFINYGLYAGLGAFTSLMMTCGLAGPESFLPLVIIHITTLVSAGLWAQTLEGSSKLSRPFGYYGSVLGALVATLVVGVLGDNFMQLGAVIILVAPWVHSIGRMRCLVQGCCHGKEGAEDIGIRYWNERSRVCTLGGLRGVPLHPTPVYSMIANVVIGVILLRLWALGASYSLIVGAYFILAGVARFVEESYRGEPQTPIIAGLRIYQWLALISFLLGVVLTTIQSGTAPSLSFWFDGKVLFTATIFGIVTVFAMGVDFPGSNKRFARLAPP
jgi:protein-S-isoprenylcysteine O-methyltransferase Ste14